MSGPNLPPGSQPLPQTSPTALPGPTIGQLLVYARSALLDPIIGPQVAPPSDGNPALQDVRVRGRGLAFGSEIGTSGWEPGSTGWPWAILTAYHVVRSYKETGHSWQDWKAVISLGLAPQIEATDDHHEWAEGWDALLEQWIASHRRFAQPLLVAGDVYWEYQEADVGRTFVESGIVAVGLLCHLRIHNVVVVPWGV